MNAPNWCGPCGYYHARDYQGCIRVREAAEQARDERLAEMIADRIAEKLAAILAKRAR